MSIKFCDITIDFSSFNSPFFVLSIQCSLEEEDSRETSMIACSWIEKKEGKKKEENSSSTGSSRWNILSIYCVLDLIFPARPYPGTSTASHPNCEVKPQRARLVRSWGTRLEARVLSYFFFLKNLCYWGNYHMIENPSIDFRVMLLGYLLYDTDTGVFII